MKTTLPKKFPLLPRKPDTDKSHYGHVFVLAGSRDFPVASVLASLAALRAGSGLVTLGTTKSLQYVMLRDMPEVMRIGLSETPTGSISAQSLEEILKCVEERGVTSVLIGPGLSRGPGTCNLVQKLVQNLQLPVVLDADGLNSFKGKEQLLKNHKASLVLTPHKKEFERLFAKKLPDEMSQKASLAKSLSKLYHVVLVLKGHQTLVVEGDRVYKNTTGNAGMASGGTGDVLGGVIAAFMAQGLSPFDASMWGVYWHGKAGDSAVKKTGELGLTATDILYALSTVLLE